MRVTLIGADFEENVGVGMIAAAAIDAGHEVKVVPFNQREHAADVVTHTLATEPDVVGLSIQFQHRAHEFLGLAKRLRGAGFDGHVTCGGQFPTLAWREVVGGRHGVDSVVLHEGEHGFTELLDALSGSGRPGEVPGLALLSDDGVPMRTESRRLVEDLDSLPFAVRYREHDRHFGVPFVPIMGGRGCWGKCVYCSITSFYRDAREHGGGKLIRHRSPRDVAGEMALLQHRAGQPCLYCFHDDNFTLPRVSDSIERLREIRAALDEFGVGKVGIIGKARPDTMTRELAMELKELGVIRLYIGVENASEEGAANLARGRQGKYVEDALHACAEAGIFACYNLLIFEPDTKLEHVRENIAFMRKHRKHPVNFCRAEPYYGTPLHSAMDASGDLGGSYLGYNYRVRDDRAELLFRVCSSAFRERNFGPRGVANRYMGLGYGMNVLEHFHDDRPEWLADLRKRVDNVTEGITTETADFLERALEIAEDADLEQWDLLERQVAMLGLEIATADARWHMTLDRLYADMSDVGAQLDDPRSHMDVGRERLGKLAKAVALTASLGLGLTAIEGCTCSVADPVPPDSSVADPPPPDAGFDALVADPPPPDAGFDALVADPPPPDAGFDAGVDSGFVADPPPADAPFQAPDSKKGVALRIIDQWTDSSPRRASRTTDLPLFDPPQTRLSVEPAEEGFIVSIEGAPDSVSARWQTDGRIEGEGTSVTWIPADEGDRLRVAVRSRGGVSVVSARVPVARD